jgi:hypothetical protein
MQTPELSDAWNTLIQRIPYNFFVTLSFSERDHLTHSPISDWPVEVQEQYLIGRAKAYYRNLSERIFDHQIKNGHGITHFSTFEHGSLAGEPRHFHMHGLVLVDDCWQARFLERWEEEWLRLNRHLKIAGKSYCKPVNTLGNAANYITKHKDFNWLENTSQVHRSAYFESPQLIPTSSAARTQFNHALTRKRFMARAILSVA